MANTRLETLTSTPTPLNRDSILLIERDSGGGTFVSEKVEVRDLLVPDWLTPLENPSTTTMVEGEALPVDTSGGVVTVTLPVTPSANDKVRLMDYTGTFGTSNCTLARNGKNIMGLGENLILDVDNTYIELTYIDVTEGWRITS
jgi:hypothetical protein